MPVVKHRAGEVVLTAGSKTGGLLFLRSGTVEVVKDGVQIASVNAPGSVFGEQAVLLDQPHTADVRTLEQSEFYVANTPAILAGDPTVALYVAAILADVGADQKIQSGDRSLEKKGGKDGDRCRQGLPWQRPSDRFRIFGAQLRIGKPREPRKAPARIIGVLVVDYGNRRNFEVLVEPGGKVVRVDDRRGAQPAYTSEEIKEARDIAEQDGQVAGFAKMKGVFVSDFGPERASDNARRIGLRYAVLGKARSAGLLAHAVVDLSARKLVRVSACTRTLCFSTRPEASTGDFTPCRQFGPTPAVAYRTSNQTVMSGRL